jgi:hypothetical protein
MKAVHAGSYGRKIGITVLLVGERTTIRSPQINRDLV